MRPALWIPLLTLGCVAPDSANYFYGVDLRAPRDGGDLIIDPRSPDVGIHPNTTILTDPNNPFLGYSTDEDLRWVITNHPNPAAGFYLWGTMLARIPIGENQFYVGTKLEDYVNGGFAVEGEVEFFEDLAVRAYLSVLNNFPDAVTYDATGTVPTPLATWTCEKLIGLGEPLPAGWLMTTDEDDNALCVHLDLEIE